MTTVPNLAPDVLQQRYALLCESTRPESDEHLLAYSVEQGLQALDQLLESDLRTLARQGAPDDFADIFQRLQCEMERVREFCAFPALANKFVVAFGGGFSAGKSSLINTLLGKKLLATEVDPTTSVATYLLHGSSNQISALNLFGHRMALSKDAFLSLTHDEALLYGSHVSRLLRAAFITRTDFAWPHLALIDTPGYSKDDSSAHSARTDEHIARAQLNAAQAVVWVVDARQGCITEDDLQFLRSLKRGIPLFIALSRADQKPKAELSAIQAVISAALQKHKLPVVGIAAFSKLKSRAWPLKALLQQLQQWNAQASQPCLAHSFQDGFAQYDQFLAQEQAQAQDALNRLNRIVAMSDHPEVLSQATHLQQAARTRWQALQAQGQQLEAQWQTFGTQLTALGTQVGMALPAQGALRQLPAPAAHTAKRGSQVGDVLCAGDGFPELLLLPAGIFQMGSNEQPVHTVHMASFAMGKYPITQAQWQKVMGSNPSCFTGDDRRPVEQVSWDDAQAFIQKLNTMTGHTHRLPSEAEWEYACRAGCTGTWCFGDDENQLGDYAWYGDNSDFTTHPVGQKKPNAFGLYDMHGHVWEWCEDEWHSDYNGAPDDGRVWAEGNALRVLRGGSWHFDSRLTRSACRILNSPVNRYNSFGFRVARTAP